MTRLPRAPRRACQFALHRAPNIALAALLVVLATAASSPVTHLDPRPDAPLHSRLHARLHTRLLRSAPVKDTTLAAAPKAIELWFSERIDLKASRVRLTDAAGKVVALSPLTHDAGTEGAPVVASVTGAMGAGVFTVQWSASSGDGHPVRGSFSFTVRP